MEPQIIDYYNETPHGVNVIDKLNEEYSELQSKYDNIKSYNNRYIAPIQIAKTYDEYLKYKKILNEEFPDKIREILNNQDYGLIAVYKLPSCPIGQVYSKLMECGWTFYSSSDKEWCVDKMINELDNITKNKNRKWCEDRINIAIETCLAKFNTISSTNVDEIIEDFIHHIDNRQEYLPNFYTGTIDFHTNENFDTAKELDFSHLNSLNCYECLKCKMLEYYTEEADLCCQDCIYTVSMNHRFQPQTI
jgi:hypothetical protein